MEDSVQSVRHQLEAIIRQKSESLLKSFGSVDPVRSSSPPSTFLVHGHRMTVILISSPVVRITFKAHFNEFESSGLIKTRLKSIKEPIPSEQVLDYFKEYCNVIAGAVKSELKTVGIDAGISLPLAARGFDELFFPTPDNKRTFENTWTIEHPFGNFRCSLFCQILDPSAFEKIPPHAFNSPDTSNSDGEMELL